MDERLVYLNEHWQVYAAHWKAEWLLMTFIAIGALYFAYRIRTISWAIISIGQILLLFTYPLMLGGYHNTSMDLFNMANEMATLVFLFGNLLFAGGLFHLYLMDTTLPKWLRLTAVILAGISTLTFTIAFAGIISWGQAMLLAPLVNVLYLINAYYGYKLQVAD